MFNLTGYMVWNEMEWWSNVFGNSLCCIR